MLYDLIAGDSAKSTYNLHIFLNRIQTIETDGPSDRPSQLHDNQSRQDLRNPKCDENHRVDTRNVRKAARQFEIN